MQKNEPRYIEQSGFVAEVIKTARRKTADIRVEQGAVTVVVPEHIDDERIELLLKQKRQWVIQKLALQREVMTPSIRQFVSGESIPYLGRNYRLKVISGHFKPAKLVNGSLVVTVPTGSGQKYMIRNAVVRWYRRHAETKLTDKVKRFAHMMDVNPKSVGIKEFKSRWGSCLKSGHIDFNWKIIMSPNRMVDYVVVHELCHLTHFDHSSQFWKEVERYIPDYEQCRAWLRENAHRLEL